MKLPTLLLLVSATGLFAAEEAKPAATTAAPAVAAPATTAPAAPAAAPKASKVPGVSDEDYQKYIKARLDIEKNDPEVKALKAAAEAAKEKAKSASPENQATAKKDAKVADKAFVDARRSAVMKKYPELNESGNKISEFWNKETAKKKSAEATPAAAPETK
jgi:hypothetical protein